MRFKSNDAFKQTDLALTQRANTSGARQSRQNYTHPAWHFLQREPEADGAKLT